MERASSKPALYLFPRSVPFKLTTLAVHFSDSNTSPKYLQHRMELAPALQTHDRQKDKLYRRMSDRT